MVKREVKSCKFHVVWIPKYRNLYKYKGFWTNGFYCESVGHISEATIKKYIDSQWESK